MLKIHYHKEPIWVTKSLRFWYLGKLHPLFSSFILYGITSATCIITIAHLANFPLHKVLKEPLIFLPAILAYSWILYGPFLIHYFDDNVLYEFWKEVRPILKIKDEDFEQLYSNMENSFHTRYLILSLPLCFLAFLDAIFMVDYARRYFYVPGIYDPFYWSVVILMLFIVFLSGFGFWGVYNGIRIIYRSASLPLRLNPLAPDRFGGLMVFGKLAIKTTLLFSSGSVLLPFLLQVSAWIGGIGLTLGILSACTFIVAIGASFIFPVHYTHKMAVREKNKMLTEAGEEYQKAFNEFKFSKGRNLSEALYVIIMRDRFLEIEKMKVYPFDVRVIFELISSIMLPILLTLLQIYIEFYVRG